MEAATNKEIDATLEKTELGHQVAKHKKFIVGGILGLVMAGLGATLYLQQKQSVRQEVLADFYQFQAGAYQDYKDKKTDLTQIVATVKGWPESFWSEPGTTPVLLELVQALREKNQLSDALVLLEKSSAHLKQNIYPGQLMTYSKGVVEEEMGNYATAIATWLQIVDKAVKPLKSEIYFSMGRVYLLQKETAKAQSQFNYIIKNDKDSEQARLAKLYLEQLKMSAK